MRCDRAGSFVRYRHWYRPRMCHVREFACKHTHRDRPLWGHLKKCVCRVVVGGACTPKPVSRWCQNGPTLVLLIYGKRLYRYLNCPSRPQRWRHDPRGSIILWDVRWRWEPWACNRHQLWHHELHRTNFLIDVKYEERPWRCSTYSMLENWEDNNSCVAVLECNSLAPFGFGRVLAQGDRLRGALLVVKAAPSRVPRGHAQRH